MHLNCLFRGLSTKFACTFAFAQLERGIYLLVRDVFADW